MTGTRDQGRPIRLLLTMIVGILATACSSGAPATGGASATTGAPAPSRTPAAPSVAAATTAATSTPAALNLDGTYRYTLTQADAEAAGDPEAGTPGQYPQTVTVVLTGSELEGGCFGAAGGTYDVDGDRITFHSIEYDADATVTFSVDAQGNLHLTPVPPMDPGNAFQCFSKPWTKIG